MIPTLSTLSSATRLVYLSDREQPAEAFLPPRLSLEIVINKSPLLSNSHRDSYRALSIMCGRPCLLLSSPLLSSFLLLSCVFLLCMNKGILKTFHFLSSFQFPFSCSLSFLSFPFLCYPFLSLPSFLTISFSSSCSFPLPSFPLLHPSCSFPFCSLTLLLFLSLSLLSFPSLCSLCPLPFLFFPFL